MNDFQNIMQLAWQIMCTEFTLYGFTISYGGIFVFTLLSSLVATALFKYLWG